MSYRMTTDVVRLFPRTLYIRLVIYYNDKEFYREDIFGPDMYKIPLLYEGITKQHSRDKKIKELGL